ncbi:hypothetical protein HDV00_007208 [Rhizophlyctis rosea]|nr:hypothetical protein HDV00_007208 [Rhizophlyctis rosea]
MAQPPATIGELRNPFPLPPPYFSSYTDEKIQTPAENTFLHPPETPPTDFVSFGTRYSTGYDLKSLDEYGVRRLYSDGKELDLPQELHNLNHSLLANFLLLIDILITRPEHHMHKIDHIKVIAQNMHHLLNTYRPHMGRDTLRLLLERQIRQRNLLTANVQK